MRLTEVITLQITSTLLLISLISFGQSPKINCDKILDQAPYFIRHDVPESNDSIQSDFDVLKDCGSLDSIDSELLQGSMMGFILVMLADEKKPATYKNILNKLNDFKKTADYAKAREILISSKILEKKNVSLEDFDSDKQLLTKVGMPQADIDKFQLFIETNSIQNITYKEALKKYFTLQQNSKASQTKSLDFEKLVDIKSAIKSGKEKNKRVLIYFSGYSSVNARKIEDNILSDGKVISVITENFSYFIAYADDKSNDPETKSTLGKKYQKMQLENFKTDYQPYFCIIDYNGKVLSEIGYTNKTEEFIAFLNKGLK